METSELVEWQPAVIVPCHQDRINTTDVDMAWWKANTGRRVRVRPSTPSPWTLDGFMADSGCDGSGVWVIVHPEDSGQFQRMYLCPHMYRTD